MNWLLDSDPLRMKGCTLVRCIAHIRNNETGEVRKHESTEILEDDHELPSIFNWAENNFKCDCNREIFFERAAGAEIENEKCSDGRFSVNLENPANGEIYYREFP